jgi:hypothetical protein
MAERGSTDSAIAARMPELVGMGDKGEPCHLARARHNARIDRRDRGAFLSETNT